MSYRSYLGILRRFYIDPYISYTPAYIGYRCAYIKIGVLGISSYYMLQRRWLTPPPFAVSASNSPPFLTSARKAILQSLWGLLVTSLKLWDLRSTTGHWKCSPGACFLSKCSGLFLFLLTHPASPPCPQEFTGGLHSL